MGYFRVKGLRHFPSDVMVGLGVGALCGIIIPELHRWQDKNISLGLYSSSEATGIAIKWQPNFLK
jgi:membrane-associated phospholipid phosphatase